MVVGNGRNNQRRSGNGSKWALGITMAVAAGTTCYYLWKTFQSTRTTESATSSTENAAAVLGGHHDSSRCVIVTETVVDTLDVVPWQQLLQKEKELTLIVVPSCKDRFRLELDPRIAYKVIRCDTILGVWSCVKSLRKRELYVKLDDFPEEEQTIPEDIPRYCSSITHWKTREDILTTFPV